MGMSLGLWSFGRKPKYQTDLNFDLIKEIVCPLCSEGAEVQVVGVYSCLSLHPITDLQLAFPFLLTVTTIFPQVF